jgi:hypothetical protein
VSVWTYALIAVCPFVAGAIFGHILRDMGRVLREQKRDR